MTETTKNVIANVVAITIAALFLFWGVTLYRQWYQFRLGEQSLATGDYIQAIAVYEAAMHMYTPFSPLVEDSARKRWQIGQTMERKGQIDRALIAYRALRSSFYAAHGLTQPGKEWIARCDAKIRQLAPPAP